MTLSPSRIDQARPTPPEPGLTPDEMLARADAMAPMLIERQADTEQRTYYGQDVHEQFAAAGFYRIMVPRRYGGYEFGLDTFLKVAMRLARACPSTGWMYCLGAAHSLVAATLFEERAQDDFFRGGDFIAPAVVAPGGTATRTEDGWVLNGTWTYCSGAPYATHLIGHAMVFDNEHEPPHPLLFIAPRDVWHMNDDWGAQLGLKGSGSHSITIENGHIAGYMAREWTHLSDITVTGGTFGGALHEHPQYGGAPLSSMALEGVALAVGMAQGALDAYEELMVSKVTMVPPIVRRIEDPDYQRWYGKAVGMIAAAEAALNGAITKWQDLCAQGSAAFTPDQDLLIAMICGEAAELSWKAVEQIIQPTAGSSAVREGQRIERIWRDLSTGHTHAGFAVLIPTVLSRAVAQVRFARELAPATEAPKSTGA